MKPLDRRCDRCEQLVAHALNGLRQGTCDHVFVRLDKYKQSIFTRSSTLVRATLYCQKCGYTEQIIL